METNDVGFFFPVFIEDLKGSEATEKNSNADTMLELWTVPSTTLGQVD